jgi:hypothetical protein
VNSSLPSAWLKRLSLEHRRPPDFITPSDQVEPGPYAGPIRACFSEVGLSAVFCVDLAPAIAFLVIDENIPYADQLNSTHKALWNQGLANLLAVIQGDILRLYSLNSRPITPAHGEQQTEDERLLDVIKLVDQTLAASSLVEGFESGRVVKKYPSAFDDKERVDSALLRNLHAARRHMVGAGIDSKLAAQLLMQAMFLAYLRDRDILDEEYFLKASREHNLSRLGDFFQIHEPKAYNQLVSCLRNDFNGGMFSEVDDALWIKAKGSLISFLRGDLDIETGQYYLYSYDFKFIPVELISEVYDVFLGADPQQKKATGSYYTPRFLAKLAVDLAWEYVGPGQVESIQPTIDPACGSGIFLVALFHRYVEILRVKSGGTTLEWEQLTQIAKSLHGLDSNPTAVLIASFSLSIALLEQATPPQITEIRRQGKALPRLFNETICVGDFFDLAESQKYSTIIGNPPWGETKGSQSSGEKWWQNEFRAPCPNREMAWPFVIKARKHLGANGIVTFLLPITSILCNSRSNDAIKEWINNSRILKILNLADMRHLLFRDASHASFVAVYSFKNETEAYPIEIWSPKSDINLISSHRVLLSPQDKTIAFSEDLAMSPVETIKMAMWAGNRAKKLYSFFETLPKISSIVTGHKQSGSKTREHDWILGQGFQPVTTGVGEKYKPTRLEEAEKYPIIEAVEIDYLAIRKLSTDKRHSTSTVYFKGLKDGFSGPRILVREGTGTRFKAAYTEQDLVFKNAVKVITVPPSKKDDGKVLAAILCSSLSSWLLLQGSQVWISRPRFQQPDLLDLPFPRPEDLPEPDKARSARRALIDFMDQLIDKEIDNVPSNQMLKSKENVHDNSNVLEKLDRLVFDYFGLLPNEVNIISETMNYIIKHVQPNRHRLITRLTFSTPSNWEQYCHVLQAELQMWMYSSANAPSAGVVCYSEDLVVLRVSLNCKIPLLPEPNETMRHILESVYTHLPMDKTRNIQLLRSVMLFVDDDLFIVKPRQIRFWLPEAAMEDADNIVSELSLFHTHGQRAQ